MPKGKGGGEGVRGVEDQLKEEGEGKGSRASLRGAEQRMKVLPKKSKILLFK